MGFRFRKSIKIAPGVRINISKKGLSSLSVGRPGATVNINKKGTRTTVGIPGSGLSHSSYSAHNKPSRKTSSPPRVERHPSQPPLPIYNQQNPSQNNPVVAQGRMTFLLCVGIFFMPYIFAWFTLRDGYTVTSRVVSFVWLLIVVVGFMS